MSLQTLQSILQQQVSSSGTIVVSEATLHAANLVPIPNFDTIIQSYLNLTGPLSVVVTAQIPAPNGNQLAIAGIASFLGITTAVSTQIVFMLEDNTVNALVVAALSDNWNFSASFPLLVGFPFAELSITQPYYLLTTAAQTSYTWNDQRLTLNQGLNFASFLSMSGPLRILQNLISSLAPTDTVVFTGTIDSSNIADLATGTPALALTGTIDRSITADTRFDLSLPQVLLTSSPDENGFLAYWLSFSSTLSVKGRPFSTFQAAIIRNSFNLSFSMLPTTNAITPAEIIGLIGGVDYTRWIPPEMESIFESVSLVGLYAVINVKTMDIIALSGSIGTTRPWPMGQFQIDSLVLNSQVLMPFSPAQTELVAFTAKASIFPNIFQGEFMVEISYDLTSKEMVIAADFLGAVSLNDLVAGLSDNAITIPKNFAEIEFNDFGIIFTKAGSIYNYTLYGSAEDTFNIRLLDRPIVATFEVNVNSATKTYLLVGGLTIGDSFFEATVNLGDGKQVLSGSWSALNKDDYLQIEDIIEALGFSIPQIPPELDLAFSQASLEYDFNNSKLLLSATSANYGTGTFIAHGQQNGKIDCTLNLRGEGPLTIAEGLTLQRFDLTFALTPAKTWTLAGTVSVDLFDHAFNLAAAYQQAAGGQTIQLAAGFTTPTPLVEIADVGGLSIGRLALELTRATAASSATSNGATAPSTTSWQLTATGGIKVENVFDFAGTLNLYQKADGAAGLIFRPTKAQIEIPLPVPEHESRVAVDFAGITLVKSTTPDSTTATGAQWRFEAGAKVALQGLPTPLQEILPDQLSATFQAGNSGIDLQICPLTAPLPFKIPAIEINGQTIALGTASIDLTTLRIRLGADIALEAVLGVGLPSELNKLFGVNDDGTAKLNFFRTYNPADPNNSVVKMQINVGTAATNFTLLSSPVQAIHQVWEAGASWWLCDFGPYGKLKCQVPIFNYAAGGFQASGGLSIVEPLQLPLTPLKQLLTACNLAAAADLLPDGVPIKEVKIVDDQNEFQVDALIGLLEGVGELPDVVKDALQTIGNQLDRLPDAFTDYLNITLPDRLFYDIAITAGGSVKGSIRTYDPRKKNKAQAEPLRLLYPALIPGPAGVPLPGFYGFQLRGISFGPLAGGSLFLLQVDAIIDQFDIATLTSSLLLPSTEQIPLPKSDQMLRRLIIDDLFMIIVYETVIPIPIPLFYDELGIEYLGIEGVGLQGHIRFPMPKVTPGAIAQLFTTLQRFFSDRAYLLDPQQPPGGVNLVFTLPQNYLQLPAYLGGAALGIKEDIPEIDTWANVAGLLNGLKTLSLNGFIQAIPIEYRVGKERITFAALTCDATWAITTPVEFSTVAYEQLGIRDDQRSELLAILPRQAKPDEQGLIVFLKGGFAVGKVTFDSAFALAADMAGFATGLKLHGRVAGLIDAQLGGVIVIEPDSHSPVRVHGQSELRIRNRQVLCGDVALDEQGLAFSGRLVLFPADSPIKVSGDLTGRISKTEFLLDGGVDFVLGNYFKLAAARAHIDTGRFTVEGTWLDQRVMLSVKEIGDGLGFYATLSPVTAGNVFKLTDADGKSGPQLLLEVRDRQLPTFYLSGAVDLLGMKSATQIDFSDKGFRFETTGKLFDLFQCGLTAYGGNLTNENDIQLSVFMRQDLFTYLGTEVAHTIQLTTGEAIQKLTELQVGVNSAQAEVDRFKKEIDNTRRTIQAERNGAAEKLRNAQKVATDAQREVDKLQGEINSTNNRINQLKREIADWDRRDEKLSMFDVAGKAQYQYETKRRWGEISTLYGKIGSIEALKQTAIVALEAAKQSLRKMEESVKTFPIDADPRIVTLFGLRETATTLLQGAIHALDAAKTSIGAVADVGSYIAKHGMGELINIHSAKFDAKLNQVKSSKVQLHTELTFMGQSRTVDFDLNFHDPSASAQELAKLLLPG